MITVATGPTYAAAIGALDLDSGAAPIVILPASLRRDDPLAGAVRAALRAVGTSSRLLLPPHPATSLFSRDWTDLPVRPPDVPATTIALPTRLAESGAVWSVTHVDAVAGSGPYVLDLMARYVDPRARIRRLASRRRSDAAVDVNLACRPACCVVGRTLDDTLVVGVTADPIAAELFALALADESLTVDRTVSGPWEDRVVQRATELELGVQIPQHIRVRLVTAVDPAVRTALERIFARIGVTIA